MALGPTTILIVKPSTKVTGNWEINKAQGLYNIKMVIGIKEEFNKIEKMDLWVHINGMAQETKSRANLKIKCLYEAKYISEEKDSLTSI